MLVKEDGTVVWPLLFTTLDSEITVFFCYIYDFREG